ncbi:LasA protease [Allocatelliglobosispora scoriae]|uniref:LasA protease n=1 Tax=Allocatelliglobosispora scoriae TaxID=643052 RepID=A0A841BMP5_9ACTN|nr:peptidoglycan DD-metalloendopeptidase family protein [Allocatelliglobosispora scoriae]MBB5868935.1 LasA protease [Allocatelliglobosispora scoriae]
MLRTRQAMLGIALLAVTISMLPASAVAEPAPTARSLEQIVADAVVARVGRSTTEIAAAGRTLRTDVQRTDATGAWAFGVGMLQAPAKPGEYPAAWLFLAQRQQTGWSVALESTQEFLDLAAKAPATVFSAQERSTFESAWRAGRSGLLALSNNTGLRLPYAVGATWTMGGGPHGWGGSESPFSSVDLSGGDGIVRAAGAGSVYTMCADSSNGGTAGGWRRVYHASGYTTDYYHLWNLTGLGASVNEGDALGNIGVNLCAGGSASGPHVHWGILSGTTRVAWHWRSAGKWVFWAGAAYGGYALHGSTQANVGTGLYNYGALGLNQGIIDAWGSGTINKRSGPGTGYGIVGSVADGTTVTISCWRAGTSVGGRWGTTTTWDKLSDGTWISDALIYTGVGTIGPNC